MRPFFPLFLKCRAMRGPSLVDWAGGGGTFRRASIIVGCRDALLSVRGEGLSGRVSHADAKTVLHLGAMEGSKVPHQQNLREIDINDLGRPHH